jgi:hypothetical protein
MEYNVAKAKEYETYKQLPKYSKPVLSVIHPPPLYAPPGKGHRAPKTMLFDGEPVKLKERRTKQDKKEIPEHLIRPEIDEEKLMKIREAERLKQQERDKSATKKRMSMAQ